MSAVYHDLSSGALLQDWSNAGQITTNDDWSGVPSIQGFLGDIDAGTATGVDPRTLTGANLGALDVNANQTNPNTYTSGGVTEFAITNPTVALQGSGTADAPSLVLYLDATGRENVRVQFNARDIDGSADDAAQTVAIQYRIGETGTWTNVTNGYNADVTTANAATQVTAFDVTLPAEANGQGQIQVRILTTNAGGSDEWVGIDDINVSSIEEGTGSTDTTVSINDVSITEGDSGTSVLTFTVTRSDAGGDFTVDFATAGGTATSGVDFVANSGTVTFTAGGALTQTISVTINGDEDIEPNEAFTVNLSNVQNTTGTAVIADASGSGTINNDDVTITKISEVQGAGTASTMVGQVVTVEAIVVGDFQNGDADAARNLNGFYLQEELADWDASALTSEGIFAFGGSTAVNIGDRVQVTGTVSEYFGMTQLNVTGVTIVQANAVADVHDMAVEIDLPAAGTSLSQNGAYQPDLEAYEGMLVTIPETLTITEQFNLDRFNEIKLVQGERPSQFTQDNAPSVSGNAAHLEELGSRTITYDDGLNVQNAAVTNLDGFAGYGTDTAPRMGDTINGLTGVLDYQWAGNSASGATWRIRGVEDGDNQFVSSGPRDASPDPVGGSLVVTSLNVLNYFTTLDDGTLTANGLEPRGANTADEFARQTEKLLTALVEIDADLFSLVELENNFLPGAAGNALEYLTNQLNTLLGDDVYDWVNPGMQFVGGDAIAPGFLYKKDTLQVSTGTTVETLSDADLPGLGKGNLLSESTIGAVFDGENTSRHSIAVTFTEIATGGEFTAVANHLKSKSGTGTGGDADSGDGQGNWTQQRELAVEALIAWLLSDPTGSDDDDFLLLGDFNAYAMEDAITQLEAAGYLNQKGDDGYSYVFDGQTGTLDYIFANGDLAAQISGVTEWHINSDEADAIDYNLDYSRDPSYFDPTNPVRVSDHDPIIIGLNLTEGNVPSAGDDILAGGNGNNIIDGQAGNDVINGGGGNDIIIGGLGHDTLSGEEGDDSFIVTADHPSRDGRDVYDGGDGVDTLDFSAVTTQVRVTLKDSGISSYGVDTIIGMENLIGGSAGDSLRGNLGENALRGNAGDDLLVGGAGDDLLFGDAGEDRLDGGYGDDEISGGADNDHLSGRAGDDILDGGDGDDTLLGAQGNDELIGGDGDDILDGSSGNDILVGGQGNDTMTGGHGADNFLFTSFGGLDTITDFTVRGSAADKIVLAKDLFNGFTGLTVAELFEDGFLRTQAGSGVTSLQVDLDGEADDDVFVTFVNINGNLTDAVIAGQTLLVDTFLV